MFTVSIAGVFLFGMVLGFFVGLAAVLVYLFKG